VIWVWLHHPPQCCHYPGLVETRVLHNRRPVEIRMLPNTNGNFWDSEKIHGGNCIHNDSLANIIRSHGLNDWRCLDGSYWISVLSAGICMCSCSYTIWMSVAWWSTSPNQSVNIRSWKFCILFNASLSDRRYWLRPTISLVEYEDKYH